jgi:formylglycine-generating enzyme
MLLRSHVAASGFMAGVAIWGPAAVDRSELPVAPAPVVASDERAPEPEPVVPKETTRQWRLVSSRHWQLGGSEGEDPDVTDAREGNRGSCRRGMVEVRGRMKLHGELDALQLRACTAFVSTKWPERCAAYDRDQWLAISKDLPTRPMAFCIDRFEYPNRKGENPIVMVSWYEARDKCRAEGKRLCKEDEWTFACEGEEATPYATGYLRDADTCVIDRPWKAFDEAALAARTTARARAEIERLWQGSASGAHPLCKSAFGVFDLTGNVDEWTRSAVAEGRPSVLKGGYWGPVRARCRPATRAHDEEHTLYQQGFRCCADLNARLR